ncbi:MAG: phosphoribosyltransferase [Rhodocyclaceae bacterium]|jgi:hypoxanthine phosphoribosyltransferase|nr:phosphoribosyltransferase [Rhodocyclaceae bacterium]
MTDPLPARIERISWPRFDRLARRLAQRILTSEWWPEVIVAIARGGLAPARVLADELDLAAVASFRIAHYWQAQKTRAAHVVDPLCAEIAGKRVLLVDDVADSGETFAAALDHLAARKPAEIRSAVVLYKTVSPYRPDYFAAEVRSWRWILFPWAVNEDVGGFLKALDPPPQSSEEASRRLAARGLHLPRRQMAALCQRHLGIASSVG